MGSGTGGLRALVAGARRIVGSVARGFAFSAALLGAGPASAGAADVARGLEWLGSQVQPDGGISQVTEAGALQLARCETATTLLKLSGAAAPVPVLVQALGAAPEAQATQVVACAQTLRQQLGETALGSEAEQRRVAAGYAAYAGFAPVNELDTGWALAAQLRNLPSTDRASLLGALQSRQAADGSFAVNGRADVLATAAVLRAVTGEIAASPVAAAIATRAAQWLLSLRNAQTQWLGDTALTAAVFEAVHPFTGAAPAVAAGVEAYLLARQQADGSWDRDPYTTAVVLRALALVSVVPLDPTRAALQVRFVDARTAAPVPGVRLQSSVPAVDAASGADGWIRLSALVPETYQLSATAAGYAAVSISVSLRTGQALDLGTVQLIAAAGATTAVVSGTVRAQEGNLPIAGASVVVEGQGLSATTAADGSYLIANVAPGTVAITASKSGYLAASGSASAAAGQVLNFSPLLASDPSGGTVTGECKITGKVLDAASGLPLAGVSVTLSGANTGNVSTGADGKYASANLASGLTSITAAKAGYDSVAASAQIICGTGRNTFVDFSPRLYVATQSPPNANTAGLSGIVLDAGTSQPLANAQLVLTPASGAPRTAQSGADGRFLFEGLEAPNAQLQVTASGYQGITFTYVLMPLQTMDIGELRLRPPKVEQLMPDLAVVQVVRATARTDAQSLTLSGSVQALVANRGTAQAAADAQLLAFEDVNRNGRFDAGVDTVLGSTLLASSLPPGGTATVSISVSGTMVFRDAPVVVAVDAQAALPDANRVNNMGSSASTAQMVPTPTPFDPVLKWEWSGGGVLPESKQVMMAPIAVPTRDTNGDGRIDANDVSDIIFTSYAGYYSSAGSGVIRILDGRTGTEVNTLWATPVSLTGNLAAADLDGDGTPEIVAFGHPTGRPVALRPNGTVLWASTQGSIFYSPPNGGQWGAPLIADLDADGVPEVVATNHVYNGRTGQLKWVAGGGYYGSTDSSYYQPMYSIPVVADLFGTGKLNLILGASVYDSNGTLLWKNTSVGDGHVAVADFDGDGNPEIVVVSAARVFLLDRFGNKLWGPVQVSASNVWGGPPTVADFDGDGRPDIGVATTDSYSVVRHDGSKLWNEPAPAKDFGSGMTGSTSFDFLGDGKPRIVYSDESSIYVLDGKTGARLIRIASDSATTFEYPIVVDADRDGHAEFVTIRNAYNRHSDAAVGAGIRVYQSRNNDWVGVRSIWNQHAYSIDNINDDLTVPRVPVQSWKTHNTFRLNKRIDGDPRALPDLTVGYLRVADGGPAGSVLTVRVGNAGSYKVPAATGLAVYSSNPSGATPTSGALVATALVGVDLQPGQWVDVNLPVPRDLASLNSLGQIWIVGDDDGTGKRSLQDFDRSNNTLEGSLPLVAANLVATVAADKPSYTEAEIAQFTAGVRNAGSFAQQAAVRFTVLDVSGAVVEVLPLTAAVSVPAGGTVSVSVPWPVAGVLAGSYTLKAEVVSPAALVYGVATTAFAVTASQQQVGLARITADRASYSAAQTVQLNSRVSNATSNTVLEGVRARTEVFNASNAGVFVREEASVQLAAGGSRQYSYSLPASGLPAGSYQARLQLLDAAGNVLAQSTAAFSVLGAEQTGVGLVGSLQADPGTVFVGQISQLTLVATNNAAQSLAEVPVAVRIVDPDSGALVGSFDARVANWAAGQSQTLQFAWTGAGSHGKTVVAAASAQVGGRDVPLGQANIKVMGLLYTGTLAADPREVEAGSDVALAYSVTNPAPGPGRMVGSLGVQTQAGQSLASWPLDLSIGAQASFAGNQLYTTGEQQRTLTAVLSQQMGTSSVVLATTSFSIVEAAANVGLQTASQVPGRILVLVSCPPGLGAQQEAACVAQRSQAIQTYLASLGYVARAVSSEQEFLSQLRCGAWSTYWLSGGAIKLSAATVGELKQAVRRGQALWMDGVHDSRNRLLHEVAGVKEIGKLSQRDQPVQLPEGGLYAAQVLPTQGQPTRFELSGGQAQGSFPGGSPAIVSNDWGQGKSLVFAFDLAGMISADANASGGQLAAVVSASVSHAQAGTPTLTIGDVTQLVASVTNQGTRTVGLKAEATLPAGLVSVSTVPQAQLTAHSDGTTLATWDFTLAGGKTQQLTWQVKANAAGSYSVPISVYSQPSAGSTAQPRLRASAVFGVQIKEGQALVNQAQLDILGLQPPAASDKQDKVKAVNAAGQAQALHAQGKYEAAIAQWLAAADALQRIGSADTTQARLAVALALEASTDALCVQRCGSAGCQ